MRVRLAEFPAGRAAQFHRHAQGARAHVAQDPGVGQVAEGAGAADAGTDQQSGILPPDAPQAAGVERIKQGIDLRVIDQRKDALERRVLLGERRAGLGQRARRAEADRDGNADIPPHGRAQGAALFDDIAHGPISHFVIPSAVEGSLRIRRGSSTSLRFGRNDKVGAH